MAPSQPPSHTSAPTGPSDGNLELSAFPASLTPFIAEDSSRYISPYASVDIEKQTVYTSISELRNEPDISNDSYCSIRFILLTLLTIIYYAACMTAVACGTDEAAATDGAGNKGAAGGAAQGGQEYRALAVASGILFGVMPIAVGCLMFAVGWGREEDGEGVEIRMI